VLCGSEPIVGCPARGFTDGRRPGECRVALAAGRLLVLAPFEGKLPRATARRAYERNEFVAALADEVFIAYAAAGSKTEAFARQAAARGKPLCTLSTPDNANLLGLGARPVQPRSIP